MLCKCLEFLFILNNARRAYKLYLYIPGIHILPGLFYHFFQDFLFFQQNYREEAKKTSKFSFKSCFLCVCVFFFFFFFKF